MKEKDKQMRYEFMLKKLEAQKQERLSKLSIDQQSYFGQRNPSRGKPNTNLPAVNRQLGPAHRLLRSNQYKSNAQLIPQDDLPYESQKSQGANSLGPNSKKQDKENIGLGISANQIKIGGPYQKQVRPSRLSLKELEAVRTKADNQSSNYSHNNDDIVGVMTDKKQNQLSPMKPRPSKLDELRQNSQLDMLENELINQTSGGKPMRKVVPVSTSPRFKNDEAVDP